MYGPTIFLWRSREGTSSGFYSILACEVKSTGPFSINLQVNSIANEGPINCWNTVVVHHISFGYKFITRIANDANSRVMITLNKQRPATSWLAATLAERMLLPNEGPQIEVLSEWPFIQDANTFSIKPHSLKYQTKPELLHPCNPYLIPFSSPKVHVSFSVIPSNDFIYNVVFVKTFCKTNS